jgi:RNA polymerase sigma-70 factor (ECF subfamily)
MTDAPDRSSEIQLRLDRLRAGDATARDELLSISCSRLLRLARKMLGQFPSVQRWEQTDDVLQNAMIRLRRALAAVVPASTASFFNLAAVEIRRELIDLSRHYNGPQGLGARHESDSEGDGSPDQSRIPFPADDTNDPARLAAWTEFHRQVEALPDQEKEVFNLLWYQGLSQAEAAVLLNVSERVVKYRWRSARLKLHETLGGQLPVT